MDMDIDVGWCLSCSKKTPDPKRPYCSDACRLQDSASRTTAVEPIGITSPVPSSFIISSSPPHSGSNPTPRASNTPSEAVGTSMGLDLQGIAATPSPRLSRNRPSPSCLSTEIGVPQPAASSSNVILIDSVGKRQRDRRAFSFPDQQQSISPHQVHQASLVKGGTAFLMLKRNSITVMPRFNRKTNSVAANAGARPTLGIGRPGRLSIGFEKMSLSTGGANTPNIPESAVWSASESDNEASAVVAPGTTEPVTLPTERASPVKKSQPLSSSTSVSVIGPTALDSLQIQLGVASSRSTSLTSQLPTARPHLGDTRKSPHSRGYSHNHSQSPVATLIATSASSRSREDIISWARAVGGRPRANPIEDEDEEESLSGSGSGSDYRGRSRTRRASALTSSLTPNQGSVSKFDDVDAAGAPGTTPRGPRSFESLSNGISTSSGRRPLLQPLTATTMPFSVNSLGTSANSPALPSSEARLTSPKGPAAPAPAEVSLVDVVIATQTQSQTQSQSDRSQTFDGDEPSLPSIVNGGLTPTLSTISFSEAVDPSSATDYGDQADVIPDDQSATMSSGFARIVKQQFHFRAKSQSHSSPASQFMDQSPPGWAEHHNTQKNGDNPSSHGVVSGGSQSAFARLDSPKSSKSRTTHAPRSPLPLRPITSTASAIWSLSNYLRSLAPFSAPFSLSSTLAPSTAPEIAVVTGTPSSPITEDIAIKPAFTLGQNSTTRPMPASSRVNSPGRDRQYVEHEEEQDVDGLGLGMESIGKTVVRSLPMDIVVPPGREQAVEDKQREAMQRHAHAHVHARKSRSRSRSRSRMRIEPSRSPSVASRRSQASPVKEPFFINNGDVNKTQKVGPEILGRPAEHKRQYSYDADASEVESDLNPRTVANRKDRQGSQREEGVSRTGLVYSVGVGQVEDENEDDDKSDRRGRSRRGKVVTSSKVEPLESVHHVNVPTLNDTDTPYLQPRWIGPRDDDSKICFVSAPGTTDASAVVQSGEGAERRGRRRDRKGESRDRSWSVGRGREIERRASRPRAVA